MPPLVQNGVKCETQKNNAKCKTQKELCKMRKKCRKIPDILFLFHILWAFHATSWKVYSQPRDKLKHDCLNGLHPIADSLFTAPTQLKTRVTTVRSKVGHTVVFCPVWTLLSGRTLRYIHTELLVGIASIRDTGFICI